MKHGSLFAGIGGFDLGFERAGIETAWQCEKDPECTSVLSRHWPQTKRVGDVETWEEWVGELEEVEVISGGFPCQDISLAGPTREGLRGERSGLWHRFADILERRRPGWVIVENVQGLLHSNEGRDLGTILGRLEELGYEWAYRVLDSQFFGVAQRRRRVIIVGRHGGPEGGPGRVLDLEQAEDLARPEGIPVRRSARTLEGPADPEATYVLRMRAGKPGGGKGPLISTDVALTIGTWQDQTVFVPGQPARKFTGTELERLFGFPDGWTSGQPLRTRERQLGNAVVVPVARWVGERMVAENG